MPDRSTPRKHTELELAAMQLHAIDMWHKARAAAETAASASARSRELRMDLDRRLEVMRAQHAAIIERTQSSLASSVHVLRDTAPLRAVVGHRNDWFTDKLCSDLARRGVVVVGRTHNGADVVGVTVAEQPDLVVVEDRLAMVPGEDVVREVRQYAPGALIAAQVESETRIGAMLQAGADAAYARRVPPLDVAADLVRLLSEGLQPA